MAPGSAGEVWLQAADLGIGYHALVVPLAIDGCVTPMIAALAMASRALIVVGNSLRLARVAR